MLKLTPRGKEVFLLIVQGFSTKRVGECLNMSVSGVRRHKENMLRENGCTSILKLMAKYYGTGGENPDGNNQ